MASARRWFAHETFDNRGGASGSIGTQVVATSPADGYTFGVVFDTHAVNPSLIPDLPYDTLKDLDSVMLVGTDNRAHQKPVKVGVRQGDDVQIVEGVKEGDRVVASGAYGLPDNTKIKVEEKPQAEPNEKKGGGDEDEKKKSGGDEKKSSGDKK